MADRIICFGDVIDDVVAIPSGAIRHDTDTPSAIRFAPGGSAANTAAWLGSLGAGVDFVGAVGAADVARHEAVFRAAGVEPHLSAVAAAPTGTIVVIVEGQRRNMLTDRGANAALDPASVTEELLSSAAVLHITGHALLNDAGADGIADLIARAHAAGVAVSIAPGSAGFIADYGVERFIEAIAGADILFPNLEEGRLLTGLVDAEEVVTALPVPTVVLTMGTGGVLVSAGGFVIPVDAILAEVVDPTGAGDAFCAGYLEQWVRTGEPITASRAGTLVAARAVAVVGGRPV